MSPHAPDTSATTPEIALADDAEPFVPKPLISDLLRTRYCVPGSIFLVEDVESLPVSRSRRWRAVRMMLGDGELCIQALLRGEMHRFLDKGAVRVGCYVRLGKFSVNFKDLEGEDSGGRKMVYLVVDDLLTVGWHRALTKPDTMPESPEAPPPEDFISDSDLDMEAVRQLDSPTKPKNPDPKTTVQSRLQPNNPTKPPMAPRSVAPVHKQPADDGDDDEAGFEVMEVSETKVTQRRAVKNVGGPVALPRDWTDPSIPLKLTTLRSIPNLPFKQNWSVNVLAIVASLSEVEPSHMPPHTQRTARLVDHSTSKQVILTVFLDAEEFRPKVGSVVLLVGVKNHRFDGGCLKKYTSDRPRPGNRWWFEEPRQFEWCDVDGLKAWWEQRQLQGLGFNGT
ncbi:hypothetical protein CMUS01_02778 [Colletotrichum musicola]|uniref:Uncharacterized protein n=1 Tax=Colletotrichum musicola TaxID=2175873 RepID=A0A8H6NUC7_9PEZI|nr:hypothetical protein CMUS01_02778 [Colletotrichum musicola]